MNLANRITRLEELTKINETKPYTMLVPRSNEKWSVFGHCFNNQGQLEAYLKTIGWVVKTLVEDDMQVGDM
ncbi:MAG: hypothetical protein ABF723_04035 [Lentilactobacillus hilgardii]|uniref:hypothetical protein n=1 Tax=Lactobacillaceae TaxID=33958 RepID=UPI001CC1EB3D|nr:hypothetical protein [Lentilactobacillus hilgardii]MBZ2200229.1 hypothetical protein [Lentilactobacillus hilgardii]MBZ2203353.1 hypothetical protein [Lentilactobacillus hilgardii]